MSSLNSQGPPGSGGGGDQHGSSEDSTSDYAETVDFSEFTSIDTAQMVHRYKNGRRYQGWFDERYGLPNDDTEQAREHLKHRVYSDYLLNGEYFKAPIGDNPQKIVDLGTGAGFWPIDVAERFPSARVIGTDISAIQPPWSPPNAEFRVEDLDDADRPWTRIYSGADLIHTRSVIQTVRHPELFLQRAYEALKPGGWIECHDLFIPVTWEDGTPAIDHPVQRLYDLVNDGPFAQKYGWQLYFPPTLPQVLRQMGFVNIQEQHTPIPLGRWSRRSRDREMGMFNQDNLIDWTAALLIRHEDLGITEEEARQLCQETLMAMDNTKVHARLDWGIVWAQKPL
ncbi:S-adenosyl-L-methionine-dependent methyltransferase [Trichoderma longibrachiatum]